MSSELLIRRIQRAYPQIWYHCHQRHSGRGDELTERESSVLGHLSWDQSHTPAELAQHLGIGASTLSEGVDKLVQRGLVERRSDADDRRRVRYRLTDAGQEAIDRSSALSSSQLRQALERLDPDDRERAVEGLELLARACLPPADQRDGGAP